VSIAAGVGVVALMCVLAAVPSHATFHGTREHVRAIQAVAHLRGVYIGLNIYAEESRYYLPLSMAEVARGEYLPQDMMPDGEVPYIYVADHLSKSVRARARQQHREAPDEAIEDMVAWYKKTEIRPHLRIERLSWHFPLVWERPPGHGPRGLRAVVFADGHYELQASSALAETVERAEADLGLPPLPDFQPEPTGMVPQRMPAGGP